VHSAETADPGTACRAAAERREGAVVHRGAPVYERPVISGWAEALAEIQARIAPHFARAEVRGRAGRT